MDESSGWLRFLYYKRLPLWEDFEMYRIKWDIQITKVYRNQITTIFWSLDEKWTANPSRAAHGLGWVGFNHLGNPTHLVRVTKKLSINIKKIL